MLKFASILTLVALLIAVAIYNDRVNHNASAAKAFDLNHDLIVELHPFPVLLEEQTQFVLNIAKHSSLQSMVVKEAWIEGINMYMGRTSVFIEPSDDPTMAKGWFFLGSCSEPQMQWRLFVRVETDKGEEILKLDFFTEVG